MSISQPPPAFHLSPAQKTQFEEDGYLVLRNFFTLETAGKLLDRAKILLNEFSLDGHPMTVFATSAEKRHVGDQYFLESGDKIRFFFEGDAFTDGKLNRPKELAVNKIGHALHELDPAFRTFTLENPDIKNLVRELDLHRDPRVIQSMVICKQKEVGGAVNSHDDSTFLYTNPLSAVGLWAALEDCTPENGCLSFVPGSHKHNPISKRLERVRGGGTAIKPIPGVVNDKDWDAEGVDWRVAECKVGDLVLIHGSVVHRSEKNFSQKSRFIYTFHLIDGETEWDEKNWLQPTPEMPFTKLY
ncbi:phytanoyl-CoA hydroxylase, partial [Phenoliferia sp. Uapishka_3]